MRIIERITSLASEKPDVFAYCNYLPSKGTQTLTYAQLTDYSDRLAFYLQEKIGENKLPIVVYGHKNPYMLVCFLACVKSGRAYVPIDISMPNERVREILSITESPMVLSTEPLNLFLKNIINLDEITSIIRTTTQEIAPIHCVKGDDTFYIIFTSGSTGKPKGVKITENCLNNFVKWARTLGSCNLANKPFTIINQAPFSFDLSVMDLYLALYSGGTLWCLEKDVQMDYKLLCESLQRSNANILVSTPSFVNLCLAGDFFNEKLMLNMELFLFCGERLSNHTVEQLIERFPKATIVNTYGPTESTVAVTQIIVNSEVLKKHNPLPVGKPKPGTHVFIVDNNDNFLPEGEKGEILIVGDTVSPGYLNASNKVFARLEVNGQFYRSYRTGDIGYMKDGLLFYCGRMDSQIKLHGYRIEIEDIENNLLKVSNIKNAVVIPSHKDNEMVSLTAFIVVDFEVISALKSSLKIKNELKKLVPNYMIPKKFVFVKTLPMTNRGKVDRKKLMEEI